MSTQSEIRVLGTATDLFRAAAEEFAALAEKAVTKSGRFSVALSGGSTPRSLYQLLASGSIPDIPWNRIFFFFGDERNVPPDHPDSNYRMAKEALLFKLPEQNVFRIRAEQEAEAAAKDYERTLRDFFKLQPGQFPVFDLILLGLGPDGHCASLFPGSLALGEEQKLVVANWVEKFNSYRITFTFPVLNHAACVIFLASGPDKAQIVREVLENKAAGLPSQQVQPVDGRLIWMLDRAAASNLSKQA